MMKEKAKGLKIIIGVCLIFLICNLPCPQELTKEGLRYLAVLCGMIYFLIANVCDEYVVILFSLVLCVILKTNPFSTVVNAFSGTTVWLLIGVLPLSSIISKSGLMRRIALNILRFFPNTYLGQLTALSLTGIVISPTIPSITAKASILSPLAICVADEMGIAKKSKEMTGLFVAPFLLGAISGHIFYSGSINVFILLGLLPADLQDTFTWTGWLTLTFLWGICIYLIGYLAIVLLYRPSKKMDIPKDFVKNKITELGAMTVVEKKVLIVLVLTLIGWITKSIHQIPEAAIAILGYIILMVWGCSNKKEYRANVAWDMIIFIGGMMCMANIMTDLGVDKWLAQLILPVIKPIMVNEYVFLFAVAVIVAIGRYFIVSPLSAVSLFYVIFSGPAQTLGIHPWVIAFVVTTIAQLWSTPYNNTTYMTSIAVIGDDYLQFKEVVKMSHAYVIISIVGIMISIPWWRYLGFIQ